MKIGRNCRRTRTWGFEPAEYEDLEVTEYDVKRQGKSRRAKKLVEDVIRHGRHSKDEGDQGY